MRKVSSRTASTRKKLSWFNTGSALLSAVFFASAAFYTLKTDASEAFGKRVQPLAATLGSDLLLDIDVTDSDFWQGGCDLVRENLKRAIDLAEKLD